MWVSFVRASGEWSATSPAPMAERCDTAQRPATRTITATAFLTHPFWFVRRRAPSATAESRGTVPRPNAVITRAPVHHRPETGPEVLAPGRTSGQVRQSRDLHGRLRCPAGERGGEPDHQRAGDHGRHPVRTRNHVTQQPGECAQQGVRQELSGVPGHGAAHAAAAGQRERPAHGHAVGAPEETGQEGGSQQGDQRFQLDLDDRECRWTRAAAGGLNTDLKIV